jgi:hypothetical protein
LSIPTSPNEPHAADAAARMDEIKAELRQALQNHLKHEHTPMALAILEVALEIYMADLGKADARKMVPSAFARTAAHHHSQSGAMRAGLAAVAKIGTDGNA